MNRKIKKYTISLFAVLMLFSIAVSSVFASPFVFVVSESGGALGTLPGVVSIINVANNYAITQFASTVPGGQTIAITSDQTKAVIANRLNDTVYVIDTATNQVSIISVRNDGKIVITPNGQKAYVNNQNGDIVVINLTNNTVGATINTDPFPFFLAVSPDGTKLYASDVACCGEFFTTKTVTVINTATDTISATITIPGFHQDIVVSPDNSKVYMVNIGVGFPFPSTGTVAVINAATNLVTNTITVGKTPVGLALTPNGQKLYVANHESHNVSVINTATNVVVSTISLGANASPTTIAITPDGTKAFVLKSFFASDGHTEVAVIDITTDTIITTLTIPNAFDSFFVNLFDRGFTESGSNVTIQPDSKTTITYSSVATTGDTSLTQLSSAPAAFSIKNNPIYFDLSTTAIFTGTVTICVKYTDEAGENSFKFLHFEVNKWVDRTVSLDTANNIICGSVTFFSPFIVAIPPTTQDLIDIINDMNLDKGLANSLTVKLKSSGAIANTLSAFINQVEAQKGKGLTETQATELKDFAAILIQLL